MLVNFSELVKSITEILPPFISKEKEYSYIFVWLSKSGIYIISFQNIEFFCGSIFTDILKFMWELEINIIWSVFSYEI